MRLSAFHEFVRCSFYTDKNSPEDDTMSSAEAFLGLTKDFSRDIPCLSDYINMDDLIRSERQHNDADKQTILICYTLLRQILAKRLNIKPDEVSYVISDKGKPGFPGDKLYFNISHTRDAFAFVISKYSPVGIDLEKVNSHIPFETIVKRFFTPGESGFIFKSEKRSRDLFFLLWTRKEALIKSFGTGILPYISSVEVFRPVNYIEKNLDEDLKDIPLADHYYIYSRKLKEYYLSVALAQKATIILKQVAGKDLTTLIQ